MEKDAEAAVVVGAMVAVAAGRVHRAAAGDAGVVRLAEMPARDDLLARNALEHGETVDESGGETQLLSTDMVEEDPQLREDGVFKVAAAARDAFAVARFVIVQGRARRLDEAVARREKGELLLPGIGVLSPLR